MKKNLMLLLILTNILPVCAFENYMIISEMPVKSVYAEDTKILDIKPVFTIDNEKNILILTAKKSGKTKIYLNLNGATKILNVNVNKNSTEIKPEKGFEYYSIDEPPNGIEILPPPGRV